MQETITLAHGNGGRRMHELIGIIRGYFSNKILDELSDAAELNVKAARLAFSTDSYVIKPLFFPGGDIGKLAVCGTLNDVAMKGAKPLYLALAFIIEEGFAFTQWERILSSIKQETEQAKVRVVTGDIKVVEKGAADGIFINTTGIGVINYPRKIGVRAADGDAIVINGGIAEHGMAILNARENLGFSSDMQSDCRNLSFAAAECLSASDNISMMRDVTRGGLATVLNEIAQGADLGIEVDEKDIPVKPGVRRLCDILGFDPLYIPNEGKFVCLVREREARKMQKAMGKEARIIGKVTSLHKKEVRLKTSLGSSRVLPMLESDQLPRIC